ncbi:hypothetical protein [Nocardia fluminea]|uniref:hypothetical protein n=1 Tax=Nocardia fluminea TaxID=134984 RepID=UPI003D11C9CD
MADEHTDATELARYATAELPTGYDLVTACRASYGQQLPGDRLVAGRVQALAQLHRTRHIDPGKEDRISVRRADIAASIDQWTLTHTRLTGSGFGEAADQLAAAYIAFAVKFRAPEPVEFPELHRAWEAVARCVITWDDLRAGHAEVPWPLETAPCRR